MAKKYKDIEFGDVFGRWTVKSYAGKRQAGKQKKDYWNCDCECGTNKDVLGEILKNSRSTSCGCYNKERIKETAILKRTALVNVGEIYGNWKVVEYCGESPYDEGCNWNTYLCECQCEWKTRKIIFASHLTNGNTKSCKKCAHTKSLIGQKFGKLLVLNLDLEKSSQSIESDYKKTRTFYICQCDCGNITSVRYDSLASGGTSSCGCTCHEFKDLTGLKYHMLTVLSYYDTIEIIGENYRVNRRRWKCQCDCGTVKIIREEDLVNGSTTSCGCRSDSKSESETKSILNKWGIKYFAEYKFENCKDRTHLPFDFYIPDKRICIELDGEDHYKPTKRSNWSDEETLCRFEDRKRKEEIKTNFCKVNRIKLIRIPYWDFDDIEYILFDKFVKYGLIEEVKAS